MIRIYSNTECLVIKNCNSGDELFLDYTASIAAIKDAILFALNVDGAEYKLHSMDEYEE